VFDNVTSEEGAPPIIPFGEAMIAPVLIAVGSLEQKAHFLPKIRTLEYWFCQGFSGTRLGFGSGVVAHARGARWRSLGD
jgi:alkylation response protein AidB-like acyl-CoA dehydrogenase